MIELHRNGLRLSCRAKTNRGDKVILHPPPNAEKRQIMALLHLETQFAKDPQRGVGIAALPQLPAKVEQPVHFIARQRMTVGEQVVVDVQRATPMALRGYAIRPWGERALICVREVRRVQFLR